MKFKTSKEILEETKKKDYSKCCDYCLVDLSEFPPGVHHCRNCHESFKTSQLFWDHIHHLTGGCRFPGNLKDVRRHGIIWYRKEKEVHQEHIPA